jgi:hypothetical protein
MYSRYSRNRLTGLRLLAGVIAGRERRGGERINMIVSFWRAHFREGMSKARAALMDGGVKDKRCG